MRYRLDNLKNVRKFYSKLINDYNEQDESLDLPNYISDTKFKNLTSALNGLARIIQDSEIENRVEALESQMQFINESQNLN